MSKFLRVFISIAMLSALLSPAFAQPAAAESVCRSCGVVESIRFVQKKGEGSGLGAVAGGVLGGVLGHQLGSGRGNTVATIAGAGAGAYAGHQVERNVKKKSYYAVTLRMDDGEHRTITQGSRPPFHDGDRVKIVDGKRLALVAR